MGIQCDVKGYNLYDQQSDIIDVVWRCWEPKKISWWRKSYFHICNICPMTSDKIWTLPVQTDPNDVSGFNFMPWWLLQAEKWWIVAWSCGWEVMKQHGQGWTIWVCSPTQFLRTLFWPHSHVCTGKPIEDPVRISVPASLLPILGSPKPEKNSIWWSTIVEIDHDHDGSSTFPRNAQEKQQACDVTSWRHALEL